MKKRMIKLLSLALVVLTAFSVVGCSGCDWSMFDALFEIQPEVPSGDGNSNGDKTPWLDETHIWTEPSWTSVVPVPLDFEGAEISVLTIDQDYYTREIYSEAAMSDTYSGDEALREAIALRNSGVTEELNVNVHLEFVGGDVDSARANTFDMIAEDFVSDLCTYDVLNLPEDIVTSMAIRDFNASLWDEEFEHFDFELDFDYGSNVYDSNEVRFPWFQSLVKLRPNGWCYYIAGVMNLSAIDNVNMIWYNQRLYQENIGEHDYEDVQQLALDGKWTYERFHYIAARYQRDDVKSYAIGFDSSVDAGKKYPMADAFRTVWNVEWLKEHPDGTFSLDVEGNDLAEQAYARIKDLYSLGSVQKNGLVDNFAAGDYIFFVTKLSPSADATQKLLHMEDINGILPMPKYSLEQSEYEFTTSKGTVISVLDHSALNPSAISAYLQRTAEETVKIVSGYHIVSTVQQKFFGTDDLNDTRAINIKFYMMLCNNLKYKFSDVYSNHIGDIANLWTDALEDESADILTKYEENKDAYQEALTDLNRWLGLI